MSGPQEYESDEQRKVRITNETEQAAQGFLRSPADWKTQLKTQYPDKDFNGKDKGEYEKLLLAEETKLAALLFEPKQENLNAFTTYIFPHIQALAGNPDYSNEEKERILIEAARICPPNILTENSLIRGSKVLSFKNAVDSLDNHAVLERKMFQAAAHELVVREPDRFLKNAHALKMGFGYNEPPKYEPSPDDIKRSIKSYFRKFEYEQDGHVIPLHESKGSLDFQVNNFITSNDFKEHRQEAYKAIKVALENNLSATFDPEKLSDARIHSSLVRAIEKQYPDELDKFGAFLKDFKRPESGLPDNHPLHLYKNQSKMNEKAWLKQIETHTDKVFVLTDIAASTQTPNQRIDEMKYEESKAIYFDTIKTYLAKIGPNIQFTAEDAKNIERDIRKAYIQRLYKGDGVQWEDKVSTGYFKALTFQALINHVDTPDLASQHSYRVEKLHEHILKLPADQKLVLCSTMNKLLDMNGEQFTPEKLPASFNMLSSALNKKYNKIDQDSAQEFLQDIEIRLGTSTPFKNFLLPLPGSASRIDAVNDRKDCLIHHLDDAARADQLLRSAHIWIPVLGIKNLLGAEAIAKSLMINGEIFNVEAINVGNSAAGEGRDWLSEWSRLHPGKAEHPIRVNCTLDSGDTDRWISIARHHPKMMASALLDAATGVNPEQRKMAEKKEVVLPKVVTPLGTFEIPFSNVEKKRPAEKLWDQMPRWTQPLKTSPDVLEDFVKKASVLAPAGTYSDEIERQAYLTPEGMLELLDVIAKKKAENLPQKQIIADKLWDCWLKALGDSPQALEQYVQTIVKNDPSAIKKLYHSRHHFPSNSVQQLVERMVADNPRNAFEPALQDLNWADIFERNPKALEKMLLNLKKSGKATEEETNKLAHKVIKDIHVNPTTKSIFENFDWSQFLPPDQIPKKDEQAPEPVNPFCAVPSNRDSQRYAWQDVSGDTIAPLPQKVLNTLRARSITA